MILKRASCLIGISASLCLSEQVRADIVQNPLPVSLPSAVTVSPNSTPVPTSNTPHPIASPEVQIVPETKPIDRAIAPPTGVTEQPEASPEMEQVSSVSQLSDVQPTEWAFQALQTLVERYGCIEGYPDRTFRGNRALTRYEFAAGLNACLNRINELIASRVNEAVKPADLETIKRLQQDFAAELTTLRGRLDTLEAKTTVLERQQFSTTGILGGEAIFGLVKGFGGNPPGAGQVNPILVSTTRLQWNSSFNGRDRFRFELETGNFNGLGLADPQSLNSLNALLSFQSDTGNNRSLLSMLEYRFAANDRLVITARPVGFSLSNVLTANFPYFSDSQGSLSRFGQLSPLFRIGNLDAGIGFDWYLSRQLRFQFAYGANNASNPTSGFLFGGGGHALGAQFLFLPTDTVQIGAAFINGFDPLGNLNTFTGSQAADTSGFISRPAQIYAYNLTLQWEISPKIVFAGWAGLTSTQATTVNASATSTTFMTSIGFRDPFNRKQGDLLAVLIGQPLSLSSVSNTPAPSILLPDYAFSLHAEVFYRFRINDNLSITPGFFLVTNPGNFSSNNTIYVGTIRSSFRF